MIKAVIFDFFGVIGESTYQHIAQKYKLNSKQLVELTDLHKTYDNGFINETDFLKTYAEIIAVDYDWFMKEYQHMLNDFKTSHAVLSYAKDLKNNYKVGLLSNVADRSYKQFIEPIKDQFDVVVTSYQVQLAKPDIEIYQITANKLGVDVSECVMVDDNSVNCQGAISAGMQAMAIHFVDIDLLKADLSRLLKNS
ncbi:MAG: HAD-IA family hydrolase [Patescibacteria group bacterium]|jgi:HAD superfamily hydrolase (TIGR01509 family)|nr:HAD-IA family hydrolase [Patescibacteria group bacterium]